MKKTDRRTKKERRVTDDRRSLSSFFYIGEKNRKILDRRCGIDRRQIF